MLRHRIITNFTARSEGLTPDDIIAKLLEAVPSDDRLYEMEAFKELGADAAAVP